MTTYSADTVTCTPSHENTSIRYLDSCFSHLFSRCVFMSLEKSPLTILLVGLNLLSPVDKHESFLQK